MKKNSLIKKLFSDRHLITVAALLLLVLIVMLIFKPSSYFTVRNFRSMAYQFPEYGILSLGMMICMLSGGIDLSLVGIMNLSGTVAALIIKGCLNDGSTSAFAIGIIIVAIVAALATGALCGLLNGCIIGCLELPAMLVTLCTMQLYKGLVNGITGGPAIAGMHDYFKNIANGTILGIPNVLFIFILVVIAVAFILKDTVAGARIYYLGSNRKAAKYSGINVAGTTTFAYTISGILGGISGVLITSHLNSAKASSGSTYTLLTILIAVLGGVDPDGGKANILGVALAVVLMQAISNAFTILHISLEAKNLASGILLVAVLTISKVCYNSLRDT